MYVGESDYKAHDPVNNTANTGYPLTLENLRTLSSLATLYPPNGTCVIAAGTCAPKAQPPQPSYFTKQMLANVAADGMSGAVDYSPGTNARVLNSVTFRSGVMSAVATIPSMARPSAAVPSELPSWIVLLVSTTQPVNTMRFDWQFASGGDGLLRVFVDGILVREIDQRHVPLASIATEEIYIGGDDGTLEPGIHRIVFRLDGFGAAESEMELTDVELGLTTFSTPLDVDASVATTKYDALTDGLLIIRYLFGLTGTSLTASAVGATATRTDPAAIKAYLDGIRPALDVDGNGAADALTDGLLIIRYLFGLRGSSLIAGAVSPQATRTTAAAIEAYIQTLMP